MPSNDLPMQTSLITGAAGFIGSHLVDRLLAQGRRVLGVDNLVLGQKANLTQALANPNFSFRELDINDVEACREFLRTEQAGRPMDMAWHLAANSDIRAGGENPEVDLRLTFLTTFNLLKVMQEFGIKRLMFASSSAIYGD